MTYDTNETAGPQGIGISGREPEEKTPDDSVTGSWEDRLRVSSYLDRCQVDTPVAVVQSAWNRVREFRPGKVGKVVDLGAGDGRFARFGSYESYVGYEIDENRSANATVPPNARLVNCCAFSDCEADADVCIGNPPFVRNQQIPGDWRRYVQGLLRERTGVTVSGLANAWQFFFLNALARLKFDGLAALIVPFEWVSRPSAEALRHYIRESKWNVHVYRLADAGFAGVLTTASITVVDKAGREGQWELHDEAADGDGRLMASASGSARGVLRYLRASDLAAKQPMAKRGLSPGTQKVLTLTEAQRRKHSLRKGGDVVPCVTSLRHLPAELVRVDETTFRKHYIEDGRRCWLIRTDREPSAELSAYIESVPREERQSKTCLNRPEWWRFKMPEVPTMFFAQGFRGRFPKVVQNAVGGHAVGGICGIYNAGEDVVDELTGGLGGMDLRDRVVAYSAGFYKVEINQINSLLARTCWKGDG